MIIILVTLLLAAAFIHYFLCYLIAVKENPIIKNANIDSIKKEVLNKSKAPSLVSIKDKMFWLFMAYVFATTYIALCMLDVINNSFSIFENTAIEIIGIIICSLLSFTVPSALSFKAFMFFIKLKYKYKKSA